MFNYYDLDDYEFEVLCRDIMERKLKIELRNFGKGVDGGIDLSDKEKDPNVIVQVKHYINSSYSKLKSTLKKEAEKVKILNPKNYYICCSCAQTLTPKNINEIYNLFDNKYMKSKENILTLQDIDTFLNNEKNKDIVRKNFKLWLSASNILSEVNNQDIFIDCDVLLSDINDEYKYYVQTNLYDKCKEIIDTYRIIMMIGSPGVGKTTISKMLILYYASQGYRVRYTTNGSVSGIKKALSSDKNSKEVILLDDCLGQCYFNIKETQEEELISLIKYVQCNSNKILILNSRVTIFNQARYNSQNFDDFIINDKIKIHVIDMDKMSVSEKAKIFFNHIYFNKVPREYYNSIKQNKNYINIINHKNYNPRIIQYITQYRRYSNIPAENYYEFIMSSLEKSKDVWKNEFENRIEVQDRILLLVLFSLTENTVPYVVLKECYNNRLSLSNEVDTSINNFEAVISRLNKSMIKIIDNNGERAIGVLNPSINDYINSIFFENPLELKKIRQSILYYEQIIRCYAGEEEINKEMLKRINDGTIRNLKILNHSEYENIDNLIVYKICENSIININYREVINSYLISLQGSNDNGKVKESKNFIVQKLIEEPLCTSYDIDKFIYQNKLIHICCKYLDSNCTLKAVKKILNRAITEGEDDEVLLELKKATIECICNKINQYLKDFDVNDFLCEFEIDNYLVQHEEKIEDENNGYRTVNKDLDAKYDEFQADAKEEFISIINIFANDFDDVGIGSEIKEYISTIDIEEYITRSDVETYIESYLVPYYDEDFDDDDINYVAEINDSCSEVEAIFESYQ